MENLIGLLVFVLVAVFSVIGRIMENKKAEQERQQQPRVRPQDLPEATRRMLYGEPGNNIPTAVPRQSAPPVVIARPIMVEPEEGPRQTAPPPPIPRPQPQRPVVVQRPSPQRPVTVPARQVPVPRPVTTAVPAAMRNTPAHAAGKRMEDASEEDVWIRQQEEERRQRLAATLRAAKNQEQQRRRQQQLFGGRGGLRQAIITRELLGPPLCLRGEESSQGNPMYW